MSKRIAYCTDGTWDTSANKTNVYRIYKSIEVNSGQTAFYDDGVGSDGTPIEKLLGGALGTGLFNKIKRGYTQISHVYEEGDEIFLFGFSRGAYTARSLAGMITACGVPTGSFDDSMVETVFQAYRKKDQREALLANPKGCQLYPANVTMVGVWDTVGALGIPAIFGGVSPLLYGFLDTGLNPKVLNAYHAMAIDERRSEFPATLWTTTPAPGQTVEQVWFAGVHCDVAGGYPGDAAGGTALSDITLSWMMDRACSHGLQMADDVRKQYAIPLDAKCALDQLHNSWNLLWGFPKNREIKSNSSIADSVVIRCQHDSSWQPKNLRLANGVPAAEYPIMHILSQPGQTVAASGT